jgi:threonine synthase
MLFAAPLALASDRTTAVDHPAGGVRGEHRDGRWHVRWRPLHNPGGIDCRIEALQATPGDFACFHEDTRGWSPFNYQVYLRRNHGAAAAAYAARAGLPCIVLITAGGSPVIQQYVRSYGAAVLAVPREARVPLLRQIVARLGYHPVSSTTPTHTGHPFGPEGYKTLAYEVFLQLGRRVPAAVFVPTGYAELFYGVWKGFRELRRLGVVDRAPQMVACEPASRAPLAKALAENKPVVEVPLAPTDAYSVAVNANGYRGVLAVRQSEGFAVAPTDAQMVEAQAAAGRAGLWAELSSVSSVAGLRLALAQGHRFDGPVVCISTSSGFKDWGIGRDTAPEIAPDWETVTRTLRDEYGLKV